MKGVSCVLYVDNERTMYCVSYALYVAMNSSCRMCVCGYMCYVLYMWQRIGMNGVFCALYEAMNMSCRMCHLFYIWAMNRPCRLGLFTATQRRWPGDTVCR